MTGGVRIGWSSLRRRTVGRRRVVPVPLTDHDSFGAASGVTDRPPALGLDESAGNISTPRGCFRAVTDVVHRVLLLPSAVACQELTKLS
jgi:hypothetical protein